MVPFGLGKKTITVSVTADEGITKEKTATVFSSSSSLLE